jgi:SAM-dependent methyltransferase
MDNASTTSEYKKLQRISRDYPNVSVFRNETKLTGSLAHGTALNQLASKVDTPYFCILDADATWLMKDWDEILINRLDEKTKIIGTQSSLETHKPADFPLIFAMLIETNTFNKLGIDFRPHQGDLTKDTGHELREKYLAAGYQGKILGIRNTRTYKSGPFSDIVCAEYYLDQEDEIFASHFGRGSNPLGKKNIKARNFIENIALIPINYFLWKRDKKRWINRCIKIAEKQSAPITKHVNVLTVHYNTQPFIENIAKLLGKESAIFFNLVVIDNSKNLHSEAIGKYANIKLSVIPGNGSEKNVLESHRSALNIALKNIDNKSPYTLFLDPDVVFSENCISSCVEYMGESDLDVAGVHKFYQYKSGTEIPYPYIWFTIIKTTHLKGFYFKPVHSSLFRVFSKKSRQDTGDSLYSLIRSKKLRYHTIPKLPKTEQLESYPMKNIQTDDWLDRDIKISISHYRGGSTERKKIIHPDSSGNDTDRFIEKSMEFLYNESNTLTKLNLGGGKKLVKNTINVDIYDGEHCDIKHDLNTFPYPFRDNSVSYCVLDNVLEHLDNPILVLKELHRILAPNGTAEIFVPYFRHGGAFQDPTHKHFFHENYFDYFSSKHILNYEVGNLNFKITKKELLIRKTGIFSNPILLMRKLMPFKRILKYFLWDIYDTVHIKLKPIKESHP